MLQFRHFSQCFAVRVFTIVKGVMMMFKIGEFAKLADVTIKTLRYYEQKKLLLPEVVDPTSGYRYYAPKQLLTIKRIALLKEQGFTLKEIHQLLTPELSFGQVELSLREKKQQLAHVVAEAQRQLNELDAGIARVSEAHKQEFPHQFTLRAVPELRVASIRQINSQNHLCLLLDQLKRYIHNQGGDEHAPVYIRWHSKDFTLEEMDIEVAVPIDFEPKETDEIVKIKTWTAMPRVASLLHQCDPYQPLCSAREGLLEWVTMQGYQMDSALPMQEVYHTADRDLYGKLFVAEWMIPLASE